jgi:hypothetical protein
MPVKSFPHQRTLEKEMELLNALAEENKAAVYGRWSKGKSLNHSHGHIRMPGGTGGTSTTESEHLSFGSIDIIDLEESS